MKLGGSQGRRPYINPANKGMAARANTKLEHLVAAQNIKHSEALRVDGTRLIIFNKNKSVSRCTCSGGLRYIEPAAKGFKDSESANIGGVGGYTMLEHEDGIEENMFNTFIEPNTSRSNLNNPNHSPYVQAYDSDDDGPNDITEDLHMGEDDFSDLETSDGLLSQLNNMSAYGNGDYLKCGVCLGSSNVDAWQPFKGKRILLEFSEYSTYTLSSGAWLDYDSKPNVLTLEEGEYVTWKVTLPKHFHSINRAAIWNGFKVATNVAGSVKHSAFTNGDVEFSLKSLRFLNSYSGEAEITVTALKRTNLTHVELTYMLAEMPVGQIPQIEVPYDHDYVDYNATVTMELGADVYVAEGEIICDEKNGRAWRVSSINRKTTAQGRGFGISAECRAIQSVEVYFMLNPFMPVDQATRLFRKVNERQQGQDY